MLLESPRFLPGDLAHWKRMEALDARWCTTTSFLRKMDRARHSIDRFLASGPAYVGVSWGKDSVTVAHLVSTVDAGIVRLHNHWPNHNPDSIAVREIMGRMGLGALVWESRQDSDFYADFKAAISAFGLPDRYISGIRADESRVRRIRFNVHGENSARTCAPLSTWTAADVFAYLHAHDLPIHPAYAMTLGGRLDRARIRVDGIGGQCGGYFGREEWERTYYPEFFR